MTFPAPLLDPPDPSPAEERSRTVLDRLAARSDPARWVAFFSGGKDSTALASVVGRWWRARGAGNGDAPHVLYIDTRVEPPPMRAQSLALLKALEAVYGLRVHHQTPDPDESFWTNLIGRGYPPPHRKFRWCTKRLKLRPGLRFLQKLENPVSLVGTRLDESPDRRRKLTGTCSTDTGECGTGLLADKLAENHMPYVAPILHWTLEDVWGHLALARDEDGLPLDGLFNLYGGGGLRYGCWVCTLVKRDRSGEQLAQKGYPAIRELLEYRNWLIREAGKKESRFLRPGGVKGRLSLAFRREVLRRLEALEQRTGIRWLTKAERARIEELLEDPHYGSYDR